MYALTPSSINSEDKHVVHGTHALHVVTLSACGVGCFSSLLQYAPPMVGEAAVFLLSYYDDTVNGAVHSRTSSQWVINYCGLWLIAWDIEVHENEISD